MRPALTPRRFTATSPARPLLLCLGVIVLAPSADAQEFLSFLGYNFPPGTLMPVSQSMQQADFDTDDFEALELNPGNLPIGFSDPFTLAFGILIQKSGGFDSPFALLALQKGFFDEPGLVVEVLEVIANADPFVAFEVTLTNPSPAPVDVAFTFQQGTLPIAGARPMLFETFYSAELIDSSGDGAATGDAGVSYLVGTSTDPAAPTDLNTTNSEVEIDFESGLLPGVPATESSGPEPFTIADGTSLIQMSTLANISNLSAGDSMTLRFAFSIGSEDGEVPLFPARDLVVALEEDLFQVVPEPSTASLGLLAAAAGFLSPRRRYAFAKSPRQAGVTR